MFLEDDRPKNKKEKKGTKRNVQSEIRNVVYRLMGETVGPTRVTLVSGQCTGKDNEAEKKDPGEESRKAGVDDQEPPPASPLLRIGYPRARLSWYSRCCRWDCGVLTFFLGIRSCWGGCRIRSGQRRLLA
jgi:hypothetical protein